MARRWEISPESSGKEGSGKQFNIDCKIARGVFNLLQRLTVLKGSSPLSFVQLMTSEFSIFIKADLGFGLRGSELERKQRQTQEECSWLLACMFWKKNKMVFSKILESQTSLWYRLVELPMETRVHPREGFQVNSNQLSSAQMTSPSASCVLPAGCEGRKVRDWALPWRIHNLKEKLRQHPHLTGESSEGKPMPVSATWALKPCLSCLGSQNSTSLSATHIHRDPSSLGDRSLEKQHKMAPCCPWPILCLFAFEWWSLGFSLTPSAHNNSQMLTE